MEHISKEKLIKLLIGEKILHKIFGEGVVIDVQLKKTVLTAQFSAEKKDLVFNKDYNSFYQFRDSSIENVAKAILKDTPIPQVPLCKLLKRDLNKGYGSKAIEVYDDFCLKFKWDKTKRGCFAPQKPLYAFSATPEGYSVLFLAHSNWTGSSAKYQKNTIVDDLIEEAWVEPGYDLYHDQNTRVVFAKRKLYQGFTYVFLGIYKPIAIREELKNNKKIWVKVFKKISDVYPNNSL